ncbi:GGDEF domain-containing protein [Candidatus Peregrinibacteria bacterium]|nr:GGDEF domain-containing protein [Candidatus Peregrinibacteria bacterium]
MKNIFFHSYCLFSEQRLVFKEASDDIGFHATAPLPFDLEENAIRAEKLFFDMLEEAWENSVMFFSNIRDISQESSRSEPDRTLREAFRREFAKRLESHGISEDNLPHLYLDHLEKYFLRFFDAKFFLNSSLSCGDRRLIPRVSRDRRMSHDEFPSVQQRRQCYSCSVADRTDGNHGDMACLAERERYHRFLLACTDETDFRQAGSLVEHGLRAYISEIRDIHLQLNSHNFDMVTGVYGNRCGSELLAGLIAEMKTKFDKFFCVFFIDIDNFKKLNDQYGHDFGNAVLLRLGSILKNVVNSDGYVYRYGGEEFVGGCILDNEQSALDLLEQIQTRFREQKFAANTVTGGTVTGQTVSIGLATYPSGAIPDLSTIIPVVDGRMYLAKRGGKDRIVARDQ